MAIDLGRFHAAFFEESFEGADVMEQGLLQLDGASDNAETINSIFRAAHSIKGGAATFGFAEVAGFAHHLETLLDRVRSGKREVDPPLTDLLLRATDVVRELLDAARHGSPSDKERVQIVQQELQDALDPQAVPHAPAASVAVAAPQEKITGYAITFAPTPDLFRSGNDPARILRELSALGKLEAVPDLTAAPPFTELDAESCYIRWTLQLESDKPEAAVREMFAWVEDECDLTIAPIKSAVEAAVAVPAAAAAPAPAVVAPASAPPSAFAAAEQAPGGTAVQKDRPAPAPAAAAAHADTASIRVSVDKIDNLINLVGELVITQAMLAQFAGTLDPATNERLLNGLQLLERNTRNLQEAVLSTRMMPIEAVFSRFPRMVRDLAAKLGKQVRLQTIGEGTELDKGVIEKIADPLMHLVRNSIDHGLENPADRTAAGKNTVGTVTLRASHQGGQIVIEVIDDGRGLNREKILEKARAQNLPLPKTLNDADIWPLIFAPGFSTAEAVTDVSGRGVGMDVVKKNIQALGGVVEIASEAGKGAKITIRLPLTLAILDGMLVSCGHDTFVIPLNCVIESLRPTADSIRGVTGQGRVVRVHDEYLPLVALYQLFRIDTVVREPEDGIVVVLEAEGRKIALQVDDLMGQQQVVIKNLETNYHRVFGISGATILGDGHVALIIDAAGMVRSTYRSAAA